MKARWMALLRRHARSAERRSILAALVAVGLIVGLRGQPVSAQPALADMEWKPTVEEYIVEQGDTLWDISRRVVGSPWLWPRVWALNPEVANPHWIYPGDQIRFYEGNVAPPSLYDLVAANREMPQEEQPAQVDRARVEVVDTSPPQRAKQPDMSRLVGLFITPKELAEAGTLTNAAEDKMLLGRDDLVFLSFPEGAQPRSGERYIVYRTLGQVTHPVTREPYGYMTQITGFADIQTVEAKVSKARLAEALVEIERGQYVARLDGDLRVEMRPVPASNAVEGVVLAIRYDAGVVAGQNNVVFIDKGKSDGVQRGNRFVVYRKADPLVRGAGERLPDQPIATLFVMDAKEGASTCLVTDSRVEIEAGYKVRAVTN